MSASAAVPINTNQTDSSDAAQHTRTMTQQIAATRTESAILAARCSDVIDNMNLDVVPFPSADARSARRAYRPYERGIHPAGLNFGDCVAYALASDSGEPLLFKGEDFSKTDIESALG
jgi:ribonuclease VapC